MSRNKRNLQKPANPDNQKKPPTINIPGSDVPVKNSEFNRIKQKLYKEAKKGNFACELETYGNIFYKLKAKGLSMPEDYEKGFNRKKTKEVSWDKAFVGNDEVDLDNYPIENCNLAQLLYITSYRARNMQKSAEKSDIVENKKERNQEQKGTILVIEDEEQGKIGRFKDVLITNNYCILHVRTLGEAIKIMEEMKKNNFNNLDGLILDFSFPIGEIDGKQFDSSKTISGIEFLRIYYHLLNNNKIPLVINTTASEDFKIEQLKEIGIEIKEGEIGLIHQKFLQLTQIFNVDNSINPLANPSSETIKEILGMFKQRTETRKIQRKIQPDKSWQIRGQTGFYDPNSGTYRYLRDGD